MVACISYSGNSFEICIAEGGTVSHHHAVGRDHRVRGYDLQRPEGFKNMLSAAKKAVDPQSTINLGVLFDPENKDIKNLDVLNLSVF